MTPEQKAYMAKLKETHRLKTLDHLSFRMLMAPVPNLTKRNLLEWLGSEFAVPSDEDPDTTMVLDDMLFLILIGMKEKLDSTLRKE